MIPPFGAPFTWSDSGINGRGDDIKKDYFFKGKEGKIEGKTSRRKQIYWFVQNNWGDRKSKAIRKRRVSIIFRAILLV